MPPTNLVILAPKPPAPPRVDLVERLPLVACSAFAFAVTLGTLLGLPGAALGVALGAYLGLRVPFNLRRGR